MRAAWFATAAIGLGRVTATTTSLKGSREELDDAIISKAGDFVREAAEFAQKVIVTVLTSESISTADPKPLHRHNCDDARGNNEQEDQGEAQKITRTVESAAIISHPKITEAPALIKRKLGSNKWDMVHDGIQGQKRDLTQCPTDFQLCPKSLSGGCCPSDRVCGSDSCLPATSTAPVSACGKLGYTACAVSDGGGCCPGGYLCGQAGCSPSAGVSYSQTCSVNSYLCPASMGFGCCPTGMGCALRGCYATSISTFTLLETIITTDASSSIHTSIATKVTVTTPTTPTGSISSEAGLIAKVPSSAVPIEKTAATGTPSSSSGLTKPQIGGIIGGSVVLLAIILFVTWLILRRLNKVVKVANTNSRTSSSAPRSGVLRQRDTTMAERGLDVDAMSIDPLIMGGSQVSSSIRRPSQQSGPWSSLRAHEVEANSPMLYNPNSPFTPQSPPNTHYPGGGYVAVATSDHGHGQRQNSLEPTPPSSVTPNRDYFDLPIQSNRDSRDSRHSRRPSAHGRNWSNASDQSGVSQMSDPAELDAAPEDRRGSLSRTLYGLGLGRMVSGSRHQSHSCRSRNNSVTLTGGPTKRQVDANSPSPGLGHIPEAGESRVNVDSPKSQPKSRNSLQQGLSGNQLRDAGMSNSQLREMTMHDSNVFGITPMPKPVPKDYDSGNEAEGKHPIYG
ncbi:hypothetical protein BJ875DRAFT_158735 [Amylocarpus encephaloides]|uniref:Uncharacterized protein n=1 Tax=Amylocarpus encephaloides TaxID=45428 RepID=A0A9P7YBE9_9HELO|nr:hypothetical protein BJ875DRAFT_158735 [Amylocarpus encephaloides]